MTETEFVALEFPSWLRWGVRKGASIDNSAIVALYPDHRHWDATTQAIVGDVRRCGWCARECTGRRTAWCSDECSRRFYRVWSWGALAEYVFARDGGICARCECDCAALPKRLRRWHSARLWQVDHITPVKDGGTDDPANLRLLCHDCHVAVGYEQRAARKAKAQPSLL